LSYGCAKIPRGFHRHKSYQEKPFSTWAALNDLFYDITYKRSRIDGGVKLKEGQRLIRKRELVRIWGWTIKRVKRFLRSLEQAKGEPWEIKQEIVTMPATNPGDKSYATGTVLTFINYDLICKGEGEELPDL